MWFELLLLFLALFLGCDFNDKLDNGVFVSVFYVQFAAARGSPDFLSGPTS